MTKYQKEIKKSAAEFLQKLLPHFGKDLQQKVRQFVDDWVNYFELVQYHADVEDLWLEVFTDDVLGGGSFFYREFASADEVEKWDETIKFDRGVVMISVPTKESVPDMPMEELAKIMMPLSKHCASEDSLLYYGFSVEVGVKDYHCRVVYHTEENNIKETDETEKYEETQNQCNKFELLKNLFSCLIENFDVCYVFDGNMDEMKYGRLSLDFEGEGENTKFILKSDGSEIFTGALNDYYMDQCRGGGSPFLFRNIESENTGICIKFNHADRFYDEYKDKDLGAKVKGLAKDYYDVWKHELTCRVRYWNYYQFGYEDFED